MKILTKICVLTLALVASVVINVNASEEIQVFTDSGAAKLMLRMDRQFIGGEVHVYSASHELIVSQKMKKRKVSIDFSEVMAGEYIVRVSKGKDQEEYHFLKK